MSLSLDKKKHTSNYNGRGETHITNRLLRIFIIYLPGIYFFTKYSMAMVIVSVFCFI